MNNELIWVCSLLVITIVLFISNKLRMDIIALLVIAAFIISGTLTQNEALAGFSDPNIVLIALLFIIGEGVIRTGIAYQVSEWMLKVAGNNELRIIILLMLSVAVLGSVMSSTGVVAIFLPVVVSIAHRTGLHPGRLMMPLSVAALISGMLTLVATAPNLVVNSELVRSNIQGFSFFSFTPIGLSILVLGVVYMSIARRWLVNKEVLNKKRTPDNRRTMRDLIRDYKLSGRAKRLRVRQDSPLIGYNLEQLHLRVRYGANVIGIERWRKFRRVMVPVYAATEIKAYDILLVDIPNPETDVRQFCSEAMLEPMILRGEYFSEQAQEVGMAEVSIMPESEMISKTIIQLQFRSRFGLNLIGIRRHHEALQTNLLEEPLSAGDTLLVIGDWRAIRQMQTEPNDFVVHNLPAEVDDVAPASSQAPYALVALVIMIGLMVSGIVPNVVAALIACLFMGATRCIDMQSAYRSIHWTSLILIIGMMPFAIALQKTGGITLVVEMLNSVLGGFGPRAILICLFILCSVIGLFISNTATAILTIPIAITVATQMGYSPYPFAMTVAIATSSAFITPVSSPVNTMVVGPGGYTFTDFIKIGLPFTILVMLLSVAIIPIFFPFH